jgi:hypothetical protein
MSTLRTSPLAIFILLASCSDNDGSAPPSDEKRCQIPAVSHCLFRSVAFGNVECTEFSAEHEEDAAAFRCLNVEIKPGQCPATAQNADGTATLYPKVNCMFTRTGQSDQWSRELMYGNNTGPYTCPNECDEDDFCTFSCFGLPSPFRPSDPGPSRD